MRISETEEPISMNISNGCMDLRWWEEAYRVGALLYMPATRADAVQKIEEYEIGSVSLCLEDSLQDVGLPQAEQTLKSTLREIRQKKWNKSPGVWVRVRSPEHFLHVFELLSEDND